MEKCDEVSLMLDKMRVQQILFNLLSNAIKFSKEQDTIQVLIETTEIQNNRNQLEISITVKDFGQGISEEDQKNLFAPFFKTSDS